MDDESLASLNSKGLQSLADSVSSSHHLDTHGHSNDASHREDDDDTQLLPTLGKKAVLHPHSRPTSSGSHASAPHRDNDNQALPNVDAPLSSQESATSASGTFFSAGYGEDMRTRASRTSAPSMESNSSSPHRHPGSNASRAASGVGFAQTHMPTLYLADSSFALPFRVTLPHGGLRPLGQSAAAYEVTSHTLSILLLTQLDVATISFQQHPFNKLL